MKLLKLLLLLVVISAITSTVMANEVAMVTEIKGPCKVSYESDTWNLELAEMIADGSKVVVGRNSSLKLLHIPENKVYSLLKNCTVAITPTGIKGKIKGKNVKLAYYDPDLGSNSEQQAGTADPTRISIPAIRHSRRTISLPKPSKARVDKQSLKEIINDLPPTAAGKEKAGSDSFGRIEEKSRSKPALQTYRRTKVSFVIPSKLYKRILQNKHGYKILFPDSVKSISQHSNKIGKWVVFTLELRKDIGTKRIALRIKAGKISLNILLSKTNKISVVSAWKCERKNQWYQAADIWIKMLENKKIKGNKKFIKQHIRMIMKKITSSIN